jgi:tetratricopeptide (TPR) repeat protein
MSSIALINRYLNRVRQATEAGNRLRYSGGESLSKTLVHLEQGDKELAKQALAPLLADHPLSDLAHFLMALIFEADDEHSAALAALDSITGAEASSYDVLCLTGDLYGDWRKPDKGCKAYDRAIELAPHASHAFLRRGQLRSAAGDVTAALADLERASLLQPSLVEAHIALGHEYRDASMANAAIASYRKALTLAPDNMDAAIALDTVMANVIPPWHSAMLNDTRRNGIFDAAIRRAVKPGSHVLDIGTGTGLLAMMAARAGAEHVTACESVGALADIARDIVARNGLSDRITIIHKHSRDLIVGEDLPRPADILITETFDAGLLNENIIATVRDARARLLSPTATVLPASGTVFALPIDCAAITLERHVSDAAGFDVAPFNRLTPQHYLQTDLSRYKWRPLTEPVELFRFDFMEDRMPDDRPQFAEESRRLIPVADGTAHAVALWFRLDLYAEISIATGPMDPPTHWQQAVYAVTPPLALKQNEPIKFTARHNGQKIMVRLSDNGK